MSQFTIPAKTSGIWEHSFGVPFAYAKTKECKEAQDKRIEAMQHNLDAIILAAGAKGLLASLDKQAIVNSFMPDQETMLMTEKFGEQIKEAVELEGVYKRMFDQSLIRFPHCRNELTAFFELERQRNKELQDAGPEVVLKAREEGFSRVRSLQWAEFFHGLHKLELERHNDEIRAKRNAKKSAKRVNGQRPFNGPTYRIHR